MKENNKQIDIKPTGQDLISRRQAIKKIGYASLSAATMMVLLNTQSAKAASNAPEAPTTPPTPGGDPIWD
jgi:hypothetical protein